MRKSLPDEGWLLINYVVMMGLVIKIHILTQKENMNKKKKTQEFTSSIIKGKDIKS